MTQHTASPPPAAQPRNSSWAEGGTVFAGILMMVGGVLGILNGIAGIATDDVYQVIGSYVYEFSLTTWGWIHLVVGILVLVTGWGVLKGMAWARVVGIALAALYMIEYFMFLPYAPVWSLIAIAIAAFVIWSLATGDRTTRTP